MSLPRLYRGSTTPIPEGGERAFVREDRRPRDTGNEVAFNNCFNLMIERRFGVPLVRQRSLFVCGDISRVIVYAAKREPQYVGIVEPVGPFRFLYAPNVWDSKQLVGDLKEQYLKCFCGWQHPKCIPFLEEMGLTLTEAQQILADPEVERGGFAWSAITLRERFLEMLDNPEFLRSYHYTDQDLAVGAALGVEIMIFDCPQGYTITPIEAGELPDEPQPTPFNLRTPDQ